MKLIRPSVEWLNPERGINFLKRIEQAGRTCYKSEDKITKDSCLKFVKMLMDRGHHAMIEHGGMISMKFITDRGVSHELVRHRLFSFAQESTRYCNYQGKDIEFVIPSWMFDEIEGIFSIYQNPFNSNSNESIWFYACALSEGNYMSLLNNRATPQQARAVLNNSLKTEIIVSGNPREWIHFFNLRTKADAHPDMQVIAQQARYVLQKEIPILFD